VNIAIRCHHFEEKSRAIQSSFLHRRLNNWPELIERFAGETFGARAGSLLCRG